MEKQFKTLVIRNLDENNDLVNILNQVIQSTNNKTGQSAIEYIIRQYDKQKIEIERMNRIYFERKKEFEEKQCETEKKLEKATKVLNHFKEFQFLIQEI